MKNRKPQAHGKDCFCVDCEHARAVKRANAMAAEDVGIWLAGKKADQPLRSCNECKAPVYIGKAAPHRPDLPIWAWQYDPAKVDWGVEYATEAGAPALCPRCRRQASEDKKPREAGCLCHQEEGDSPCPVHGEEAA